MDLLEMRFTPEGAAHMVAGIQTDAMVHVCTGGYVHSRVNNPTSPRPLTKAPVFAANDSCR